ncbi:hypothetical protein M3152_08310 [Sporosarcina luteola]|uniref:hypothetical protein n=1 Tax=Sporosarcina luteola TaxID=582850 RepID=UPI0020414AB7|nr:hypothetical protein [Sporosarcina luteola]MCM3637723.1 hypothetical protein [Sporosarcina luteola]
MTRKIQPVSFNLDNDYENDLHEFAMEQDKYFSKYVKRLIERDRTVGVTVSATSASMAVPEVKPIKFNKSTVKAFL